MDRICNTVLVLSALVIITSCGKEIEFNDHLGTGIRSKFLVDRIYADFGNLLAEYIYDSNNRLTQRIETTLHSDSYRTDESRIEDRFEYKNGRVSKIITYSWSHTIFHQFVHERRDEFRWETTFEYDRTGRLIRSNGGIYGHNLDFRYENELFVGFINNNEDPWFITDTMVYDISGNIIKHISCGPELNMFGQPIPETTRRDVRHYEYDNNLKPNFGLDYLYTFHPIRHMGVTANVQQIISKNNMTKAVAERQQWIYTYNENGLPKTIGLIFDGVESQVLLRIYYKQIR